MNHQQVETFLSNLERTRNAMKSFIARKWKTMDDFRRVFILAYKTEGVTSGDIDKFCYSVFKEGTFLRVTSDSKFYYHHVKGRVGEVLALDCGGGSIPMTFTLRFGKKLDPSVQYKTLRVAGPFGMFGRFNMELLDHVTKGFGYETVPETCMEFVYKQDGNVEEKRKRKR